MTHGYDAVLEISEAAYQKILSAIFDTADFLMDQVLSSLNVQVPPGSGFDVSVSFDRPAGIPANATDVIDVHVTLGANGSIGALRFAAGLAVIRLDNKTEILTIDLRNKLWIAEASIFGIAVPADTVRHTLADDVGVLYVLPLPADQDATAPEAIKEIDVKLIDDTSPQDRDASAVLLTFGGGSAGNRDAFGQSFLSPGGDAGMVISMAWLCRTVSPLIDQALGGTGAFQNCQLTRHIGLPDDVTLTDLTVTLASGALKVHAAVSKSGTCYDATGTVDASIAISVQNGVLKVDPTVGNPVTDVDIPWYCYVVAGLLGAVTGGLFGIIGAVVGSILLPTIMYVTENVMETAVNSAAAAVANAINSAAPAIDLAVPDVKLHAPVGDISFQFSDAFIDDVQVDSRVVPADTIPIHTSGVVTVPNGYTIDFDSGHIGHGEVPSGDLTVRGSGAARKLAPVCGAAFARTPLFAFGELYRAAIYPYHYSTASVPLTALGIPLFGLFIPDFQIVGVRTNENRWGAFQVIAADSAGITLRYRVWEKFTPSVRIVGHFSCRENAFSLVGSLSADTLFTASAALEQAVKASVGEFVTARIPEVAAEPSFAQLAATHVTPDMTATTASAGKLLAHASAAIQALEPADRRIGAFTRVITEKRVPYARFDARTSGIGVGAHARWEIDGIELVGQNGTITTPTGTHVHFDKWGLSVAVTVESSVAFDMQIAVTVADDRVRTAAARQCVHFEPTCVRRVTVVPPFDLYRQKYLETFGTISASAAVGPVIR